MNSVEIIDGSTKYGVEMGCSLEHFFEKLVEEVSKRGGHFSAHSCAVDLKVVAIIKSEVIHGENHADEVANGASRNGVVRISA